MSTNSHDDDIDEGGSSSSIDENEELNEILSQLGDEDSLETKLRARGIFDDDDDDDKNSDPKFTVDAVQWSTSNGKVYIPTGLTVDVLSPGVYEIRSHPSIGTYFEKIPVRTEGLVEFTEANTFKVTTEIQNFWDREEIFRSYKLTYKRGIMLWGPPGGGKCLAKGTPVMMHDGSIKPVEDVHIGDMVMGDDSTPRSVLGLARGRDMMYQVTPVKGDPYVVNSEHVLSLKRHGRTSKLNTPKTEVIDISVKDWLNKSRNFKSRWKGYRATVDFSEQPITVDPYFLGLWLGDGNTDRQPVTTADQEIHDYIGSYAEKLGMKMRVDSKPGNAAQPCVISAGNGPGLGSDRNPLLNQLRHLGVLGNKHIPNTYKMNSREVRLEVLSGLMDSDGSLHHNGFDYISQSPTLADDVAYLCRSLGLAAYIQPCEKSCQNNYTGTYYRVSISGDTDIIPTRVLRKRAQERQQIKDALVTGITVEPIGEDDYYGFEIDGNHRFLLGDFTVTHNSCTLQLVSRDVISRGGIVVKFGHPEIFGVGMRKFREIQPNTPVVVLMEDIDSTIRYYSESEVINILDGVDEMDKIVFLATTNYPEMLGPRIMNRPSRFDKRFKVDYPSTESRKVYFNHLKGDREIPEMDVEKWVEDTARFSIAHMKELFVAVVVLGDKYDDALKTLKSMKTNVSSDEDSGDSVGFRNKTDSTVESKGFGR